MKEVPLKAEEEPSKAGDGESLPKGDGDATMTEAEGLNEVKEEQNPMAPVVVAAAAAAAAPVEAPVEEKEAPPPIQDAASLEAAVAAAAELVVPSDITLMLKVSTFGQRPLLDPNP